MPQKFKAGGPSAGLPPPNTVNQRPKYIQQSANQIMNTPFLQLTESLTSGHYARSLLSVLVPYNMEEWKVTKAHITWG